QALPAGGVIVRGDQRRRQTPHLLEAAIVGDDLPVEIDHENAVRRRFEGRLENRDGERVRDSTGFLRPLGWTRGHAPESRGSGDFGHGADWGKDLGWEPFSRGVRVAPEAVPVVGRRGIEPRRTAVARGGTTAGGGRPPRPAGAGGRVARRSLSG